MPRAARALRALLAGCALGLLAGQAPLRAQSPPRPQVQSEVFAGGELEDYLRLLQTTGAVPLYPWSLRGFSPFEVSRLAPRDSAHPWAERYAFAQEGAGGAGWGWVRPSTGAVYNTLRPYGANDGALWAGRGATFSVQGGVAARYGPVSLTLAPLLFWAQNRDFELLPNGQSGRLAFADALSPGAIDLPQRFGDAPYARLDPGQSTLRVDLPLVTAGVSTANQYWGPALAHPLVLGNNAPGFPHLFVGSSAPIGVGVGRLHARAVWGILEQSDYSVVEGRASRRFMSGVVGVFTPRFAEGLEIGGTRFFHSAWPEGGPDAAAFAKPLEGFLKVGRESALGGDGSDADNQLASVFFRWVLPRSGFEAYGEYAREDHAYDVRDLTLEPDHTGAYTLGFRKAWERDAGRLLALRGEVLNSRVSHLARVRHQTVYYRHNATLQGHTHRGQALGSAAAYGGGGAALAAGVYGRDGRWELEWSRSLPRPPGERIVGEGAIRDPEVTHALTASVLRFVGPWEIDLALAGVLELNGMPDGDAAGVSTALRVRRAVGSGWAGGGVVGK